MKLASGNKTLYLGTCVSDERYAELIEKEKKLESVEQENERLRAIDRALEDAQNKICLLNSQIQLLKCDSDGHKAFRKLAKHIKFTGPWDCPECKSMHLGNGVSHSFWCRHEDESLHFCMPVLEVDNDQD